MTKKSKEKTEETESTEKLSPKQKAIQIAIAAITKEHGAGTILVGQNVIPGVKFMSTQCDSINDILGGGWARGRIIEIFGPESSGKTTLALHAIAEAQKNNEVVAFIDVEHALDINYASSLGIKIDELLISQPDYGEQAMNIVKQLICSKAISLIIIDSVAALVPKNELEGNIGDSHMGLQARLMGQTMRVLSGLAHEADCTTIFINQLRHKIGIIFGSPEVTTGGNALKFYASQRVDIRRIGIIKDGTGDNAKIIANKTKIKVVKNKVAPPFKETEVQIRYGTGIDIVADIISIAVKKDIIDLAGSWYSFQGEKLGQGSENVRSFLIENPEKLEEIRKQLKNS